MSEVETRRPVVGDDVLFFTSRVKKHQPYPAKVTHVHADGEVNLNIFNDAEFHMHGDKLLARVPKHSGTGMFPPAGWCWPHEYLMPPVPDNPTHDPDTQLTPAEPRSESGRRRTAKAGALT